MIQSLTPNKFVLENVIGKIDQLANSMLLHGCVTLGLCDVILSFLPVGIPVRVVEDSAFEA